MKTTPARLVIGLLLILHVGSAVYAKYVPSETRNAGRDRYGDRSRDLFKDENLQAEQAPEDPRAFGDLNVGLPSQIEKDLGLKRDRSYVILIKKSPQYVFDFRSADYLRRSLMLMSTGDMDIGHAMVAWQCRNSRGGVDAGATGQTGEQQGQGMKMLRSGWGLSTFMSSFSDGYLNDPEEVDETIEEAAELKRLRFLAVEVTPAECQQMLGFLKTYIAHPKQPQRHFGLNLRPQQFEGGGCGSFAVAMLEQLGVFKSMTPNIWSTVDVPTHLLGVGDKVPPYTDFYKKIPYQQSILPISIMADAWTCRPGWAPCHKLRVADPEMIIHLITALEKSAAQTIGPKDNQFGEAALELKSKERWDHYLVDTMDRSGEIGTELIDAKFDQRAAKMEAAGLVFLRRHLQDGGKLRVGRLASTPGLIFEKGRKP